TVVYWTSASGAESSDDSSIYTIPLPGGAPHRLCADFASAEVPVWMRDSRIIFYGVRDPASNAQTGGDWWVVSPGSGEVVKTGAVSRMSGGKLRPGDPFAFWRDRLIVSGNDSDATNLWEVALDNNGHATSEAKRITYGSGDELYPSVSDAGRVAFTGVL